MATLEGAQRGEGGALDALGRRVGALEASGGEAKTALDEARAARADAAKALAATAAAPPSTERRRARRPSALEPRLAKLESDLAAAEARLSQFGAIDERLAKLEAAAAQPASRAEERRARRDGEGRFRERRHRSPCWRFRSSSASPPARRSRRSLAALSQLGVGADALAPLKPFAESGAPSLTALAASWAKVEPAVAAAAPPPERSGWDRLLDHMRALVRVHRVGEAAGGDESDPPVAQVGAALDRGDLAAALAAFAQLPEASRAAGARLGRCGEGARGGGQGGVGVARRGDRQARGGEGLSRREKKFFTSGALSS